MREAEKRNRHEVDRTAGVVVPIFAIRYEGDLGIGDVLGARFIVDWLESIGMRFFQMLPINETGQDHSPYNCISSVALEPSLLDVRPEGLDDLDEKSFLDAASGTDLTKLRHGRVNYAEVKSLKLNILWRAFDHFWRRHYRQDTERDRGFHTFCASEQEWLGDYCLFRLLMDMEGGSENWEQWHEDYSDVSKARSFIDALLEVKLEETEKQLGFYAYVQWVAYSQWNDLASYAHGKGVELMGDIPFGISYCSADVYCQPQLFDLEWSGGAPPEKVFASDPFTERWGQNWGIPLYRWDVSKESGHLWWRRRVEKVCEVFSLFRIDHALGFYRIYSFPWRPQRNLEFLSLSEEEAKTRTGGFLPRFRDFSDDSDEHRSFNREAGECRLAMIRDAAGSSRIIAEDLGVVPDYVRPSLEELGIAGMKVPQWEEDEMGNPLSGDDFPENSLITYATHDHEPLKVQWNGWQVGLRNKNDEGARDMALRNLTTLAQFSGLENKTVYLAYSDTTREALLRALFESGSAFASVMITDLLGFDDRYNSPGSVGSENWTSRMDEDAKELVSDVHWAYVGSRIRRMLEESSRL